MTALPQADRGRIVVDIPPDFHEIPLASAVADRAAAQTSLIETMELSDSGQREGLGLYLEAVARSLGDGPVVGTSFCAVSLAGSPSTATLTLATSRTDTFDPLVALTGIAEALLRRGAHHAVGIERTGPHSVVVARSAPGDAGAALHQITVAVPVPGQPTALLITLATPHAEHLATYEQVVRQVAGSVRVAGG